MHVFLGVECGKAHPSTSYSSWDEILAYFQGITTKSELYKYIKLQHKFESAIWNEDEGIWTVKVKDLVTGDVFNDWVHIVINGTGILKYVVISSMRIKTNETEATGNGQMSLDCTISRATSSTLPCGRLTMT